MNNKYIYESSVTLEQKQEINNIIDEIYSMIYTNNEFAKFKDILLKTKDCVADWDDSYLFSSHDKYI